MRKVMALVAVVALVGMMPAMALAQQGRTELPSERQKAISKLQNELGALKASLK